MANSPAGQFDPNHFVQQATQAWQQAIGQGTTAQEKLGGLAASTQPMLQAFGQAAQAIAAHPHQFLQNTLQFHQSQLALGANMLEQMLGRAPATPVAQPEKGDKRFEHESWNTAYFNLLKQSYLLTCKYFTSSISQSGLDDTTEMKALFYTSQFLDLLSPSNYLFTNPEAISTALATNGESLVQGFKNMLSDMQSGRISMTDYEQFKVGENIAVTKGSVVYRNRLIELIQYAPATKQAYQKPLLICPPWINRYYILDLKPENSFVNYMVSQGFTVFMISWKNPDASYRDVGFDDYIKEGLQQALSVVQSISGEDTINTVGYCIGGTMLATALSVMQQQGDNRINSATFFTTLTDFAKAGELTIFTDDYQVSALEAQMQQHGVLDGRAMAATFSALRANDLIWSFVVNNYLLGKSPFPFDLLYWNDDSTRMPCAMHSWYLRKLYVENKLVQPGALTVLGTPVDLRKINLPLYMVTGLNDHIAPWEACYPPFANMASKSKRFVLTKAGHVAGVVNPPTPAGKPVKRSFWVAEADASAKPEAWLKTATEQPDSWWPDYAQWLATQSGPQQAAPAKPGNSQYKPLCPAPGTYVVEK